MQKQSPWFLVIMIMVIAWTMASPTRYGDINNTEKNEESAMAKKPIFMIHKHAASHLHFDLRIEIDGVLKSWAVPKGPSCNTAEKRLAILVQDHQLSYAKFEGVITEGYGTGTVMIWDTGTITNCMKDNGKPISLAQSFKNGHMKFMVHAHRMQGMYALIRKKSPTTEWLLIKMDDEYAQPRHSLTRLYTRSVVSDNTMRQIAAQAKEK
jgi:DNA ligase D-like protein (predicted 3'-phosphoesterase)